MSGDDTSRILDGIERIEARLTDVGERLARMEVQILHHDRAQDVAAQDRVRLATRIGLLEAEQERRAGDARTVKWVSAGGGVAGLVALLRTAWDTFGPHP